MARRKKYAHRNLAIYSPKDWVGHVFKCQVSDFDKTRYLVSLNNPKEFATAFEVPCDQYC